MMMMQDERFRADRVNIPFRIVSNYRVLLRRHRSAHALRALAAISRSGFEIARAIEIENEPGLHRLPIQQFARSLT
jgi:hypothetical protein